MVFAGTEAQCHGEKREAENDVHEYLQCNPTYKNFEVLSMEGSVLTMRLKKTRVESVLHVNRKKKEVAMERKLVIAEIKSGDRDVGVVARSLCEIAKQEERNLDLSAEALSRMLTDGGRVLTL